MAAADEDEDWVKPYSNPENFRDVRPAESSVVHQHIVVNLT